MLPNVSITVTNLTQEKGEVTARSVNFVLLVIQEKLDSYLADNLKFYDSYNDTGTRFLL